MARRHGSKGEILLSESATGTPAPTLIASMNAWSLSLARDKEDVTAFGDTNKQYVQGLPDISGSLGGWWDVADIRIFEISLGDLACFLKLVPSTLDATYFFSGPAYLDGSVDVSATGAISVSSEFVSAGDWAMDPVALMAREGREGRAGAAPEPKAPAA